MSVRHYGWKLGDACIFETFSIDKLKAHIIHLYALDNNGGRIKLDKTGNELDCTAEELKKENE